MKKYLFLLLFIFGCEPLDGIDDSEEKLYNNPTLSELMRDKEIKMNINEKIKKNFRWVFELSGHDWSVGHEEVSQAS